MSTLYLLINATDPSVNKGPTVVRGLLSNTPTPEREKVGVLKFGIHVYFLPKMFHTKVEDVATFIKRLITDTFGQT
jgi:hypothetical protein